MSKVPMITSPLLSGLAGVRHGFFTRRGGVSHGIYESLNMGPGSGDDPGHVTENRRRAAAAFGVGAEALLTCDQIHSSKVVLAEEPFGETRPRADGVVTVRAGLMCGALSADCAPVLIVDAEARVVAAAHAGWRGALGGVVAAAVETMVAAGADRSNLVAAVGPCIGPASYEVGVDFLEQFAADSPESTRFFAPGAAPDKRMFDLPGFVLWRLAEAGIGHAEWVGHDTAADESNLFSNRRAFRRGEKDYGRLLSAVMLET